MKVNRITSFVVFALALLLVLGQFVGGAHAAPPAPAAHFQASGITAQANPPAKQDTGKAKTTRPTDQSPLDFTVQGRLTDPSGNPITVATAVVFNLYSVPTGGTAELTQNATVTPDSNGLFTYLFVVDTTGSFYNVSLFDYKQYLGITVGSDAEMTPRFELTASPYAMSLAPGAQISGNFDYSLNIDHGLLNLYNTNTTASFSSGLYASGNIGVWGDAHSNTGGSSFGGDFTNNNNDPGNGQYGVEAYASNGWGVTGSSAGGSSTQDSAGVVGVSVVAGDSTHHVAGGVFTDTNSNGAGAIGYGGVYFAGGGAVPAGTGVSGYGRAYGNGVYGQNPGQFGAGTQGDARNYPNGNGDPSAVGGLFDSYDGGSTHLGLQVNGQGHATGGFYTGLGYYMTVKYNGSDTLQRGDILALDGNNVTVNGSPVLGAVKANAANAGAAIGVAAYRLQVFEGQTNAGLRHIEQTDTAGVIKPGDLVQIVIAGQASVKVSGSANIGDHLAIGSDGSLSATKADTATSIGKVASQPDSNGMVTVFVNFK